MSELYVVHVSDTHFALPTEDLRWKLAFNPACWGKRGIVPAIQLARVAVIKADGCAPHDRWLWTEFLRELGQLAPMIASAGAPETLFIHTGDVTQAGQRTSLSAALGGLSSALGQDPKVVSGNHDLWPEDFPPCAASRTSLQCGLMRDCGSFPRSYPDRCASIRGARSGLLELHLLNSAIPDSLLNAVGLGKIEQEMHGGAAVSQLSMLARMNQVDTLRAVAVHHPVLDIGPSWRRAAAHVLGLSPAMALLDGADACSDLVSAHVGLVLCGHEHTGRATLDPSSRILQLAAGCPTLHRGTGNDDDPQFSLYVLRGFGQGLFLDRFVCLLAPARWQTAERFQYDGATWSLVGKAAPPASLTQRKPPAPFP
jgi:hypothetical protein